jgi:hypothetical protein
MQKLGLATDLPPTDREAFEKYLTAFADPLTPSKQEALQMLFSPDFDPVAMNRLGRAGGGGSVVGRGPISRTVVANVIRQLPCLECARPQWS